MNVGEMEREIERVQLERLYNRFTAVIAFASVLQHSSSRLDRELSTGSEPNLELGIRLN